MFSSLFKSIARLVQQFSIIEMRLFSDTDKRLRHTCFILNSLFKEVGKTLPYQGMH